MRLTPSQVGIFALLGEILPFGMPTEWSLMDRIKHGRDFLVKIAKVDFGYDPVKWHEYLRNSNAGAYRWSNKHLGVPKMIEEAMNNADWCQAVKELAKAESSRPNPN